MAIERFFRLCAGIVGLAIMAFAGAPVVAHHSFATFDATRTVVLDGTVRTIEWTNPHIWIELVVAKNGQLVTYRIEGASPISLGRKGWVRTAIKPGDKVLLTINPLKSGEPGGAVKKIQLADGRTFEA